MSPEERSKPRESSEESSIESTGPLVRASERREEWLPDWAPWAALTALLGLGVLGGLGFLPGVPLERHSSTKSSSTLGSLASSPAPLARGATSAFSSLAAAVPSADDGARVTASHVLVSYAGAPPAARQNITRTKDEAKRLAADIAERARKGADFARLVADYSDDPSTKPTHGNIGRFGKRHALPAFGNVAFSLKPGELGIAETGFGYHVILRTE